MINVLDMHGLLMRAIRGELLIVTETSDEAELIRREVEEFVGYHMSRLIPVWKYSDRVIVGGFYDIYVVPLQAWNEKKRYKPFGGAVLVTDKKLSSGIKNIAEGVVIKLLPVERGGENAEMS